VKDHGRGEVRRKILDAFDSLQHRVPTAYGVERRVTDAVHGRFGTHPVIQRIRILQRRGAEELGRIIDDRHGFRLNATWGSVNGAQQS
jgi:hypothetical protein